MKTTTWKGESTTLTQHTTISKTLLLTIFSCILAALSLVITPTSHASTTNASWVWPGQKYFIHHPDGWYSCSVGFPATDQEGNHYFITAGHCFRSNNLTTHYMENPSHNWGKYVYSPDDGDNPAGWERIWVNLRSDHTYLDVSLVQMYPGQKIYGPGWEHIANNPIYNPHIGDTACIVGYRQSSANCGVITLKNVSYRNIHSLYGWADVNKASYCALPGDSGGAVYNQSGALGIQASYDPAHNEAGTPGECQSTFVPISDVLNTMRMIIPDLVLA